MLEQWEEFKAGPARASGNRLYVSLNQKGQFLLSRRIMAELGNPDAVTLLFEKRSGRIAIRPASSLLPQSFSVKKRAFAHSRMVFASPFCRNYGIKVAGTVAFHGIRITNERMLILDLENTTRVSRVTTCSAG